MIFAISTLSLLPILGLRGSIFCHWNRSDLVAGTYSSNVLPHRKLKGFAQPDMEEWAEGKDTDAQKYGKE